MIYFLDTSALAKRYVNEPGSAAVRTLFRRGRRIAVSRLAAAELAAAVARLQREGKLSPRARDGVFARVEDDFAMLEVVEIRPATLRPVAGLCVRSPLRAYDAVQLACALALRDRGAAVDFWSGDARLVEAAQGEGLKATLVP